MVFQKSTVITDERKMELKEAPPVIIFLFSHLI